VLLAHHHHQQSTDHLLPSFYTQAFGNKTFPDLRIFYLDDVKLTSPEAAKIVDGLAKGCRGLEVLVLGESIKIVVP
jgi:hypothetical protein